MKTTEGLLRYDRLEMEAWCFDMGHEIIPVESGMQIRIQLLDDRFQSAQLLETPDKELTVIFDGRKRKEPLYFTLDKDKRYLVKMSSETVDDILDNAQLLDFERESVRENSEPDTNAPDDGDFYF